MEGGERSAHNDTPVLIERTGASSAQTRSSGVRREARIVCIFFQPVSPTMPRPGAGSYATRRQKEIPIVTDSQMVRWTGSLGAIT